MIAPRQSNRAEGHSPPRSFFQYLDILRDRWISASLAFLVVAGLVAYQALHATPSYESRAMIQLDLGRSGHDPLADLTLTDPQANVDAELEVMGSFTVAKRAAEIAGIGVRIQEQNAYRPWESLTREFSGGGAPTRLAVRMSEAGAMPSRGGSFHVDFDATGTGFTVREPAGGERWGPFPFDQQAGAEIEIRGDKVRIEPEAGSPAGKRFVLRMQTVGQAAAAVRGMGFAEQVGQWTGIVHLGARADDPYLAERVAKALTQSYLELKQYDKETQITKRLEWLTEALAKQEGALNKAMDQRDGYLVRKGAILLGEKATAAFDARRDLLTQRMEQEQILMELQSSLDALRATQRPDRVMAAIGESDVDAQTRAIADSLVQLEVRRGTLLRDGSSPRSPTVRSLDAEIAEAQQLLNRRIADLRAEVDARFERRISAVNNRLEQIRRAIADQDKILAELPEEKRGLVDVTRDVEAAQQRYVFLERMKGEAEIARSSTITHAKQIDPAMLNMARQSPVLYRRALMAIFLGLFAAIGVALLRHMRDRTVHTPRDLEEKLGLQLYAAIPTFQSVPRRQRRGLKSSLVVRDVPNSTLTENYRTLRANLRFADTGKPIQAMTITSAMPKEGKTVTTLNLASAMARAGNSVLVVDADLRRPMVDTHLEGKRSPGITDALLGKLDWHEAVQLSSIYRLSFISAGSSVSDPSTLLEAGHFETMLAEMRKEYEYVLFDVPPVLAVADAAAFFRSLDAVLLVSRRGACPVDIVAGAQDQVERFGGNLIGAVFNGFDARRAGHRRYGYGGYYGYHAYHGYYAEHSRGDAADGVAESDRGVDANRGVVRSETASEDGEPAQKK